MTRAELLVAIDKAFRIYIDQPQLIGPGSLDMVKARIETAVNEYCDGINQTLSEANEILDGLVSGESEMP